MRVKDNYLNMALETERKLEADGWDQPHRLYAVCDDHLKVVAEGKASPLELMKDIDRELETAHGLALSTEAWDFPVSVYETLEEETKQFTGSAKMRMQAEMLHSLYNVAPPSAWPVDKRRELRLLAVVLKKKGEEIVIVRRRGDIAEIVSEDSATHIAGAIVDTLRTLVRG